jgi:hypothetical protein
VLSVLVGNSEIEQVAAGQPPGTSFLLASRWGGGASAVSFSGDGGSGIQWLGISARIDPDPKTRHDPDPFSAAYVFILSGQ